MFGCMCVCVCVCVNVCVCVCVCVYILSLSLSLSVRVSVCDSVFTGMLGLSVTPASYLASTGMYVYQMCYYVHTWYAASYLASTGT